MAGDTLFSITFTSLCMTRSLCVGWISCIFAVFLFACSIWLFFTHLFCFLPSYMSIAVTWSVYPTHSNEFLAKALFSFWLTMHPNFVTAGYKIGFNIADRVKAWSKRSCNISNLSEGKEIGWAVNLTDHLSHPLPLQRYLFWFISLLKKEHIISGSQWTCHLHIKRHSYTLLRYREASG